MKTAVHPEMDIEISVADYFAQFGGKHEARWGKDGRPRARCPACLKDMQVIGEDRPVHDRLFKHMPDKENRCPLKNLANARYELLPDAVPDKSRGIQMRADFFLGWEWHFGYMQKLTDMALDIQDFISRIELADQNSLWSRRNLQLWEIPYILLVWREFQPVWSASRLTWLREDWLRFWFDGSIRTIEDLWIRTQGDHWLVKASYVPKKRGGTPGLKQLKSYTRIKMSDDFIAVPQPRIHTYVRFKMIESFPNECKERDA